ncbi:MAG: matrixin family metalloprotease [Patescibacteria group bacterium]|nr:matrixin family metalloprotease [Patescibacteria group bacterium]
MRTLTIFVMLFACGCTQTLPANILIGSNFEQDEADAILSAFDKWEQATGREIIIYRGRYIDADYDFWNMIDNYHVVYKAESPTPATEFFNDWARMKDERDSDIAGFGMLSDIIIYWYTWGEDFDIDTETEHYDVIRAYFLWRLEDLVMHEIGHFLGLGHNDDPDSIMNIHHERHWPEPNYISDRDVDDFCHLYDCP